MFPFRIKESLGENVMSKSVSKCLLLLVVLAFLPSQALGSEESAAESKRFDMLEAVDYALENNYQIKSFRDFVSRAEYQKLSVRGDMLPQITATSNWTDIKDNGSSLVTDPDFLEQTKTTHSLRLRQLLFDGLSSFSEYQRAAIFKKRSEEELRRSELELIFNVQSEFLQYLRSIQDIQSFEKSVERLENQLSAARAFFDVEMAPRLHVLQTETELSRARQDLSRAQNDKRVFATRLRALMALPKDVEPSFEGNFKEFVFANVDGLETCLLEAVKNRPDIKIAEFEKEIAEKEIDTAKGRFYPSVFFDASINHQEQNFRSGSIEDREYNTYNVGFSLQWELFNGGSKIYDIQDKQSTLSARDNQLNNTIEQVNSNITERYYNIQEALDQINLSETRIHEAKEAYESANERYRSGIGTSIDVLDAEQKLTSAQTSYNQSLADYQIALARLYFEIGERNKMLSIYCP